jgi:two-component system chemotaxis response regulator CheY
MDKAMKILIVDDFLAMRLIIKNLLHDLGFQNTSEADDGKTALPLLRNGNFDFLITDWNMPGMDGLALVKAIRADNEFTNLPILMISAEAKRKQIILAAASGVNGYIVKPFTTATIEAKIEEIFASFEA